MKEEFLWSEEGLLCVIEGNREYECMINYS